MKQENVVIAPPNLKTVKFVISGTNPLVQLRYSEKVKQQMLDVMSGKIKQKPKKGNRDYDEEFHQAYHTSKEGWYGIPAVAFRRAMISACRVCGFKMTQAKLSVFVEADGYENDGTPLVKITKGKPEKVIHPCKNSNMSLDWRVRAMWKEWEANLTLTYDADLFSMNDIANLVLRAGLQVGILEGRHDGKTSSGMGWGTFKILNEKK